jgi:hypothetical protein
VLICILDEQIPCQMFDLFDASYAEYGAPDHPWQPLEAAGITTQMHSPSSPSPEDWPEQFEPDRSYNNGMDRPHPGYRVPELTDNETINPQLLTNRGTPDFPYSTPGPYRDTSPYDTSSTETSSAGDISDSQDGLCHALDDSLMGVLTHARPF